MESLEKEMDEITNIVKTNIKNNNSETLDSENEEVNDFDEIYSKLTTLTLGYKSINLRDFILNNKKIIFSAFKLDKDNNTMLQLATESENYVLVKELLNSSFYTPFYLKNSNKQHNDFLLMSTNSKGNLSNILALLNNEDNVVTYKYLTDNLHKLLFS